MNKKYYELNNRIKDYELTVTYSTGRKNLQKGSFGDFACQNHCEALRLDGEAFETCLEEKKTVCQFEDIEGNFVGGESIRISRGCVTGISLKILSVFPGKKFKDTCISEITLQIPDPKIPDVPEAKEARANFEKERQACK